MKTSWYDIIYPKGFKEEFIEQLIILWPLVVLGFVVNTTGTVAVAFCGHLGTEQLGAVSLAQSIITAFGFNVAVGFSSASDTLFSQIYGGDNKRLMGVVLQRSVIIYTLVAMLCIALYINAEYMLVIIGVPLKIASLTNEYLLIFLPGLLAYFWYTACLKFFQNQDKVIGNTVIGVAGAVINILLHLILVKVYHMNIMGSALAFCLTYVCILVFSFCYIFTSDICEETWGGFSSDAWHNWGQFFKLGVAGIFLSGFEWWMVEIGLVFSGSLGDIALGAFSVLLQVEMPISNVFLALGYAANIRVGHHLGGDKADAAMTAATVSITMAAVGGLFFAILCVCLKSYLPQIFTSQEQVLNLSGHLFPALGAFIFFECINTTSNGILRGCGLQYAGAMVSFLGFGLALAGVPVMYFTTLTIEGYWIILACCSIVNSVGKMVIISDIDWKTQVFQAYKRTQPLPQEDDGMYKGKVYGSSEYYHQLKQEEINDLLMGSRDERVPTNQLCCRRFLLITLFVMILAASITVKMLVHPDPQECTAVMNCTLAEISNVTLPQHIVRSLLPSV